MPLASAWSLWWVADRIGSGFAGFWDAPIFFPTQQSFAFSEPLLLEGAAAAPLAWAGVSPVPAHNLVLLAALVANGAFAFALLRGLGLAALPAGAGGAMVCLLPYVHHELGVLTLVPLAGVLAVLHALLAFSRSATPWRGVRLGVAFAAAYALCGQYALFLALVAAPAALCLFRRALLAPRSLLALALAAATACALLAPVVSAQLAVRRTHGFARPEQTSVLGAAAARLLPPGARGALGPASRHRHRSGSGPAGALPGHPQARRSRSPVWSGDCGAPTRVASRRFSRCSPSAPSCSRVLPRLELFGVAPFHALRALVPGLAQVRSFWRATMLMQLAIVLLAAEGIQALVRGCARAPPGDAPACWRSPRSRWSSCGRRRRGSPRRRRGRHGSRGSRGSPSTFRRARRSSTCPCPPPSASATTKRPRARCCSRPRTRTRS